LRVQIHANLAFTTLALPCAEYEVAPLECPNCGAAMRIIALIDDTVVIERILRHLKVWDPGPAPEFTAIPLRRSKMRAEFLLHSAHK